MTAEDLKSTVILLDKAQAVPITKSLQTIVFDLMAMAEDSVKMVSFDTEDGEEDYTVPSLNGRTIVLVAYGQLVLDPAEYGLVGSVFSFNMDAAPDGVYKTVIFYQ